MADKKISDFTAATSIAATDLVEIETAGGNSRKVTFNNLRASVFRGARVRMNADDTTQNITAETPITFDVADIDTDTFWSAGAPTRLTIGADIVYVSLVGQIIISSSTGDTGFSTHIHHRNSADTILRSFGNYGIVEQSGSQRGTTIATGPVAVSSGDYFTLAAREETDASVTIEGNLAYETFLALHVLG